jgi:competence protein ComEA
MAGSLRKWRAMRINRHVIRDGLYLNRKKAGILVLILVILIVSLCLASCSKGKEDLVELSAEESTAEIFAESTQAPETADPVKTPAEEESSLICVYICGAVTDPGVYELLSGARVFEAVEAAGGLTADAAEGAVNQAALLNDGDMITIPTAEEMESAVTQGGITPAGSAAAVSDSSSGKININTAGSEELQKIPGVGPSKAQSIIDYREEHGAFTSPEDLMKITGIKEKTYEKMKDSICVR